MVEDNRQTSGENRLQKSQVRPVRLHLLGVQGQGHHLPDPVRRRCSTAWKIPHRTEADQAKADEPYPNDGHGRRVARAGDGRPTRDRVNGTVIISQENYNKSLLERYGKMQSCVHTRCENGAFAGPAAGEPSGQGGEAAFSGHLGQRTVPRTGALL